MKKKVLAFGLSICATMTLIGCGKISDSVITIEKYKGLEIEAVQEAKVTAQDVEASIRSYMQAAGKEIKTEVTDRGAQIGDIVTVDYTGKKDGVAFEGGTATDQEIELGNSNFIDGFEEGIHGHKVNETFDVNVTFPENYGKEELNGQPVVFTFTLKKIVATSYPELTDALATELVGEEITVAEYKKKVQKDMEASNEQSADAERKEKALLALMEQCEIKKYPEKEMEEEKKLLEEQYSYEAAMWGMDLDAYLKNVYNMTVEECAQYSFKQRYALEAIAKKEKIKITDEEYEKELQEIIDATGYTKDQVIEAYEGKTNIKEKMLINKVVEFLVEHAKELK